MQALTIISEIMVAVLFVYFLWLFICDIIGVFCKKKRYPQAEPYNFAVMICARNEENVIGNLLDSFERMDYPKDKFTLFVVAHNCSDDTARIAREHGAIVFERNDPTETFKGHALKYGVEELKRLYPDTFDALTVFDADNVAGKSFLKEINNALHSGFDVVQGFRNSKNYHENAVTELFGAYWYQIMICQNLPHTAMHLPATIGGTGFGVKMDALEDGWETFTMLEDIEFTCQMVLKGKRCGLAPYAMFYDEQPQKMGIGLRQRYRWAVGGYQVMSMYLPKFIKAIPKRGVKAIKMMVDLLINPVVLTSLIGYILRGIISCVNGGPLGLLTYIGVTLGTVWLSVLPCTLIMLIRQRMNPFKNIWTLLFFPYFLLLSMVFSVPALFDRNPKWKAIPHTDTKTIDCLE